MLFPWLVLAHPIACDGPTPVTPPVPTRPAPTTPDPTWQGRFRAELEAAGFVLADGAAARLDPAECCGWESCYLFNPDNDYVGWWLPPGPGQAAVDPIRDEQGRSLAWRLRPDEAVVAVGRTPPPAAYFSYRSYIHDRWTPTGREWLFYNLGDSINHFVIGTGEGGPFDADFVMITTADAGTDAAVRAAAERAGVPASMINTDAVATPDMTLGLDPLADTFRMQGRVALFDDPAAGAAYLAAPPVEVWRVSPAVEQPHAPIEAPPLRLRGTGTDEQAWAAAFDELDAAIRSTHADYVAHDLPTVIPEADEQACPPGCNRDTFFAVVVHFLLPEDADAFVMVYGVNHQRTGKSVYSNFSVIGVDQLSAAEAVHSGQMPGSADRYLPDHPQAQDLYAWKVARTCAPGEPHCIAVPYDCPGFGSGQQGSIAFRAYTEAATATGPLVSELVVDRAVLFTRPPE